MENQMIRGRLEALREAMRAEGVDYYMMPTADFHNSEYVNDYFKVREYFSGFSGSNGTLVVWQEGAGLWTDGRYFIQAERELEGTGIELFRMQEEGVPTIREFLKENMKEGQLLGFDGRVIPAASGKEYERELGGKGILFAYEKDLAEGIWKDRPGFPAGTVTVLKEEIAGKSFEEKRREVMEKVEKEGASSLLLTKLDDLMWLFNIRGCDVECNPVAICYGYLTQKETVLFIQKKALNEEVQSYLSGKGILVEEYDDVIPYLRKLPEGGKVLADQRHCSYCLFKVLSENQTVVEKKNPTELLKAVKNPVELANMEKIFLKDSVAVTKFIYWLKKNIGKQEITEVSAADELERFRREIPEFLDLSFPTIAGYKANAAMMHYAAAPESAAVLKPEGLFLVDSGGQYYEGTTDITRTMVLGPISEEQKLHFTTVLRSNLRLANARFLHGCTGLNLDILARGPIWDLDLDYKCGTGHGIGYLLNVHEAPNGFRWRIVAERRDSAVLEEGMVTTDEPGIYIEGSHGIRTENELICRKGVKNGDGQFMYFEPVTYAPIDLDGIEPRYLTQKERQTLNDYHAMVYSRLFDGLTAEERDWLKEYTRSI